MRTGTGTTRIVAAHEPTIGKFTRRIVATTTALCALTLTARAGTFTETLDAGEMPGTAQTVGGSGALDYVLGALGTDTDVDMFRIYIADPAAFSASTQTSNSTGWIYDTQLFLFSSSGTGIWANDDAHNGDGFPYDPRSTLSAGSTGAPTAAGIYYIAISGWDRDPVNAGGNIFNDDVQYSGTLGPAGPGGTLPIASWDGSGNLNGGVGSYQIAMTGAEFVSTGAVPEPGMLLTFCVAGAIVHTTNRRAVRCPA